MTTNTVTEELQVSSRKAVATRRLTLLTAAQLHRAQAARYRDMGLYSVAARETISAAKAEASARHLSAWSLV
jgi:hypothetical protein